MKGIARFNDRISGGLHCHGHEHGPLPTPGRITAGSRKVFVEGRPVARAGDPGHSPLCCGGIGLIVLLATGTKLYAGGVPIVVEGDPTKHCGMGDGVVVTASKKVRIRA